MRHIFLDYNSTTPLAPAVQEAMVPFLSEYYGVPTGSHWLSRASAEAIEDARSQVAGLIGATREEIVFTSGATESVNLAIKGTVLWRRSTPAHVVVATIDHGSVLETAQFLESWGCEITYLPLTGQGVITAAAVESALRPETALVCIPHAAVETGALQPVRAIAEVCHRNEVLLHVNAAGTAGRVPIQVDELEADFLSLSAHKLYAPKGAGALFVRRGLALEPLLHGPGHESGLRGGTQHLAGIVGFGRAASLIRESLDSIHARSLKLRERLLAALSAALGQALDVFGEKVARLGNTLCIAFPGVNALDLLSRAPEVAAYPVGASQALLAMGVSPAKARGAVRLSVGWYTTEEEIDRAAAVVATAWESLRA